MHEDLLKRHLELVIEANKTTNITRISSWEDGMVLHVQDSLLGLDALNACPEGRYADIGTGAGYPGIPLAIETGRPTLLVDSVQKKVQILDGFIEELGLENVSTYAGRIEDLGREQIGQFAAISARALSKLSILLELSSPLLKMGGRLICFKALVEQDELDHAHGSADAGMRMPVIRYCSHKNHCPSPLRRSLMGRGLSAPPQGMNSLQ